MVFVGVLVGVLVGETVGEFEGVIDEVGVLVGHILETSKIKAYPLARSSLTSRVVVLFNGLREKLVEAEKVVSRAFNCVHNQGVIPPTLYK
jgi:hypothetical protein